MANFPSASSVVPDKIHTDDLPKVLRDIYTQISRNVAAQDRVISNLTPGIGKDNQLKHARVAHALQGMGHQIAFVSNPAAAPGDVAFLIDEYNWTFGSGANPGSGGVTPSTLPASPASPSVLTDPGTGPVWVTIPTRVLYLDANELTAATGAPTLAFRGTAYPDLYNAWELPTTGQAAVGCMCEVPADWTPATALTFKAEWATNGAAAQNWVPLIKYKERADGDTMTDAAVTITGPTTSANFAAHVKKTTTVGSFTPSAASRVIRLMFERNPAGADNFTGSIYLMALRIEYVPLY